ncbi:MAG: hypothetical protein IAE93_14810 [Ignavibacteria bacterium]|nr:hypothetical protein [Ignavibacteria bacterium]
MCIYCYFLFNDEKKVTKEKSPAFEKLAKIILASLQEKKLPPLKRFKSFGSLAWYAPQVRFV